MKRAKHITISEYHSPLYWNPRENLKKLVNKEARLEYGFSNTGELREVKAEKVKWSVGLWNFFKSNVMAFLP